MKSSSSPADPLSGISQTPTRGAGGRAATIFLVGFLWDGGMSLPHSWYATSCHREAGLLFASTRMPRASRPETLSSGRIAALMFAKPPFLRMQNGGVSGCFRQRCRTTCASSGPYTKRTRLGGSTCCRSAPSVANGPAILYRTSMPCSATVSSSSFVYSTAHNLSWSRSRRR